MIFLLYNSLYNWRLRTRSSVERIVISHDSQGVVCVMEHSNHVLKHRSGAAEMRTGCCGRSQIYTAGGRCAYQVNGIVQGWN